MKADPSSNIMLIPYDKFKELTCYKTPEEIIELRRQLLKDNVDILCVVDSDGPMRKLAEIIFINYEKLLILHQPKYMINLNTNEYNGESHDCW